MASGNSGRHEAARDEAWRAFLKLGVSRATLAANKPADDKPKPLVTLTSALAKAVVDPVDMVLAELGRPISDEERLRIISGAAAASVQGVISGIAEAIARELSRPQPVPFAPPAAGSWIRARTLPRAAARRLESRTEPTWDGVWHVFCGDWREADRGKAWITGRTRCGTSMTLRHASARTGEPSHDYVSMDDVPTTDGCRRCLRLLTA
jgi:hypothetical protein